MLNRRSKLRTAQLMMGANTILVIKKKTTTDFYIYFYSRRSERSKHTKRYKRTSFINRRPRENMKIFEEFSLLRADKHITNTCKQKKKKMPLSLSFEKKSTGVAVAR